MKKKINLAELLKDCPKGMELDCTMFENLEFDHIEEHYGMRLIVCCVKTESGGYNVHTFTEYGCYSTREYSKCVIFPKGKTTWEGFHRPFVDGDVVVYDNPHRGHLQIFIFKNKKVSENNTLSTCYLMLDGDELDLEEGTYYVTRLATEEEKQKLFDAIRDNGYNWNADTKTLEKLIKPKFKVGDRIRLKGGDELGVITQILENCYEVKTKPGVSHYPNLSYQDCYELVQNKFDITTLIPFESKVLVRDYDYRMWIPTFWGKRLEDNSNCNYLTTNGCYKYCIPYEGNKYLLGSTNDCDEFYKTWE